MRFEDIKGNESVRSALAGMVDSGKVPHAIMFHENDGCGAISLCLAFLQYLNCHSHAGHDSCGECPSCNKISKLIHPDVHFVYPVVGGSSLAYVKQWRELVLSNPYFTESELNEALGIEGKSAIIAVPEAKTILEKLAFNSLEGGYKAVVVYLPEKMNVEAANRLLKSIEEPPEKTQFLLITHAPEKVLTTISSRCQSIRLMPSERPRTALNASAQEEKELFAALMDAIVSRNLYTALEVGEKMASLPSRERMKSLCANASEMLRKVFLVQQGLGQIAALGDDGQRIMAYARAVKKSFARLAEPCLSQARMLIERNVNPKIVFSDLVDRLFVTYGK